MPIDYLYETPTKPLNEQKYTDWFINVLQGEDFLLGNLCYLFMSDDQLLELNRQHLDHDYYTDIITFDYSEGTTLSGDMCISVDRVKDNASTLGVSFEEELNRVMVHGLLHLMGYSDKSEQEQEQMRIKEDEKLQMFHVEQWNEICLIRNTI